MDRREFIRSLMLTTGTFLIIGCIDNIDVPQDITDGIPDYYFENQYLDQKIKRIKELLEESGSFDSFIFITDPHWEFNARNSPLLLNYIQKKTGIKRLFCGGDVADGCSQDSFSFINLLRFSWEGEVHCVVGNHEYLGKDVTEDSVFNLFDINSDIEIGNKKRHYYYVDDYIKQIRYVILSSFSESKDGGIHSVYGYGEEQCNWIKSNALNVGRGWKVVFFTHFLYWIGLNDNKISQPAGSEVVESIIDSYSGPGEIIAIFHGHNHRDRIIRTPQSGIPIVVTSCDKNIVISEEDQQNIIRPSGTIIEQAFDVVIINDQKRLINCVRIGCPAKDGIGDEVGKDVEERIVKY